MKEIGISEIKELAGKEGSVIRWTGVSRSGKFCLQLQGKNGEVGTYASNPLSWDKGLEVEKVLAFVESDARSPRIVDVVPPDETPLSLVRRAASFGVNLGSDAEPGDCKRFKKVEGCVMSYDIETSMKNTRPSSFDLLDSEVISIASACSCGRTFYTCSEEMEKEASTMVSEFLLDVLDHSPLWLIGWNCYCFDNECMRYHASDSVKDLFLVVKVGSFGGESYGSIVNVPGTYNVDHLVYMLKSPQYRLPSYKLGDVALELGVKEKMKMPDLRGGASSQEIREYNMNDCIVAYEIWRSQGLGDVIQGLAACMASPVYDCCRYVTGQMTTLAYCSLILSMGLRVAWGRCYDPQKYEGGYVMAPVKGLHSHVFVCDYASMYPTIVASCGIDPHSMEMLPGGGEEGDGIVSMSPQSIVVAIGGKRVRFGPLPTSPVTTLMKNLIERRKQARSEGPSAYSGALKVAANSLYGCLGYSESAMYSPLCAAAITLIGRYAVRRAREEFERHGLLVVYGDTDSCMVSGEGAKSEIEKKVTDSLCSLHSFFSKTTLSMMKLQIEEYYPRAMMVDKKRYCLLKESGDLKLSGISLARGDATPLCKLAADVTVNSILREDRESAVRTISIFIDSISSMAMKGEFRLSEVSRYTKKDGQKGYSYPGEGGRNEFVPGDEVDPRGFVRCDVSKVIGSVAREIERFTIPCGLGRTSDIVRSSTFFVREPVPSP